MIWLIPVFALVALFYASVGFGGGSTYSALLALTGVDYRFVPVIALLCNIIVVTGGSFRFIRANLIDWRAALPLLLVSAPAAFMGGLIPLKEAVFYLLLGFGLLLSAVTMLLPDGYTSQIKLPRSVLMIVSATIGLLAGLSGIGGGIFMAPVLHLVRWAEARRIAAFASIYILINSVTGITGQLIKGGAAGIMDPLTAFWPLMIAVLIGGQLGSHLGLKLLSPRLLRSLTAILVSYVALRLVWQGYGLLT